MWESPDQLLEYREPLISREGLKLETSNLACSRRAVISNEKLGQKLLCGGRVIHFWNFAPPLISRERLKKLQTSNLVWRRTVVSSNEKMQN